MHPHDSTGTTHLNRCEPEKDQNPASKNRFKPTALFYPGFSFSFCEMQSHFCSGSARARSSVHGDFRKDLILLGPKAGWKIPQGQRCKCSVFSLGARVLQSAHYKSCGKSDSIEKSLKWSGSFLEAEFWVYHELLYF